jgi:hypothetical protein
MAFALYSVNIFTKRNHRVGLFPGSAQNSNIIMQETPPRFQKNNHVKRGVALSNNQYDITYRFKDHREFDREWRVGFPAEQTESVIHQFGIPHSIFQPFQDTEAVRTARRIVIEEGLFIQENNIVRPDLSKMASQYRGYTQPIADIARQVLGPSPRQSEVVEFLLRFCQDIPYGIPPNEFNGKYTAGIFPPAQVLVNVFGDCDSKAVLFASALSHFGNPDLVFVHSPGHVSVAIHGVPNPYQKFFVYKNKKYIFAEPVGPGRQALGYAAATSTQVSGVRELYLDPSYSRVNYTLFSRESAMPQAPTSDGKVSGMWSDSENGQMTFWLSSADYGTVTVFVNGQKIGELDRFHSSMPECGGPSTISAIRPGGTYQIKATSSKGYVWNFQATISNNKCQKFRMGA